MKVRRFYPKQVINKLKKINIDQYGPGEKAALEFFYRKSRRYGWGLSVITHTSYENLENNLSKPPKIVITKR